LRIEGVQVGKPLRVGEMRTGLAKQPVTGPVQVGRTNLEGDGQADRRYHGGVDMAALAYSADHYPDWRAELSWPELTLGGFGENLSVSGASEASVCIGDVWRAGTAVFQLASPRKPCHKISAFWGRPELLELVRQNGRTGWYLRVIEEGWLEAGSEVKLLERPHPEWTVRRAIAAAAARRSPDALALAELDSLSVRWRLWLRGEPARV
jgi:MOSC domain-containing protein YiiM